MPTKGGRVCTLCGMGSEHWDYNLDRLYQFEDYIRQSPSLESAYIRIRRSWSRRSGGIWCVDCQEQARKLYKLYRLKE